MSAVLLCRHPDGALQQLDVLSRSIVALGVHGSGIITYDVNTLKQLKSFTSGIRYVRFTQGIVSDGQLSTLQAVIEQQSSTQQLVKIDADARTAAAAPDAAIELSSHVISVHRVTSEASKQGITAIVTVDGSVLTADWSNSQLSKIGSTGTAALKRRVTASTSTCLLTAAQAEPGSIAQLKFFTVSSSSGQLVQSHACNAAAPAATSALQAASLAAGIVVLLWSDGSITVELVDHTQPLLSQHTSSTFRLGSSIRDSSTEAPAAASNPTGGKKRKAAEPPKASSRPSKTQCAAVSSEQFLTVHVDRKAGSLAARYSYVDSRYGCELSSGTVALEGADGADAGHVALVPMEAAAGRYALQVGGTVYCLELPVPRAGLLSLVGRLAVNSSSAAAGAAEGDPLVEGAASSQAALAPAAAAAAGLDFMKLVYQQPEQAGAAGGFALQPPPAWLQPSAEQQEQQAAAAQRAAALQQLAQAQRPTQAALRTGVQQLQQAAADGSEVDPQAVAAVAAHLAEAQEWDLLSAVVYSRLLRSLAPCPGLLPALAQHHRYQDLATLLAQGVEVPAGPLVETLQHLLTPAGSESGKQAQEQYCEGLRQHAESAVAAAEAQQPGSHEWGMSVALAKCAAAVVGGFSARELCIHPLLATYVDAVEVQAALRRLDSGQVRRLLGYLSKWLDKYSAQLGQELHSVQLPQQLMFPMEEQVLEWARMTLDAHLARLALAAGCQAQLARMQAAVQRQLASASGLLPLRGVTEHMVQQAALPQRAVDHANRYLVELLDLRVA